MTNAGKSIKNAIPAFLVSSLFVVLLSACGGVENEYSDIRCYCIINNGNHQDPTLASAMNAAAPGVFCKIRTTYQSGASYFSFENNQGLSSQSRFDGEDQRRSVIVGLNNSLIVGFSNSSIPAKFYAFDGECPNCFDYSAIPVRSHPLEMTTDGLARCNTCHRTYALNNNGVVSSGDGGKKLTPYHSSCTGPYGVLSVQ